MSLKVAATPSSSSAGFFQTPPDVLNQFYDDTALRRGLTLFLPKEILDDVSPDLASFGAKVLSPQVLSWVLDAERNTPYVKTLDSWGRRRDELITSEGWRNLQAFGIAEGMVAIPYENKYAEYSRVYHFAKYALWCGSAAWVNCPSLMSDGVVSLFRKYLTESSLPQDQRKVLQSAYDRLVSREPNTAWTTGQWMTERQGGSDVSMTETIATYTPQDRASVKATDGNELGPWRIDGFKWFSSATDCNMMVMLAQTSKGISTFFAPMRKTMTQRDVLGNDTVLNGVSIQRLKNKLGTRALPTAELELKGVRAWLIGEDGRGTKEIATVLNIARIHNGATAIGLWGRGLGIVRAFVRVRVVGRRPLWERTAFMRSLARMHAEYKANVLFNLFVAGLLGVTEQDQIAAFTGKSNGPSIASIGYDLGFRDVGMAYNLFRLLTPALKGHCSKTAISGLQECMECLGGVGYLENDDMQFNIARLYRDANVMPIWEGTTDMMADDSILRVLHGKLSKPVMSSMETWVGMLLKQVNNGQFQTQSDQVRQWWADLKASVEGISREEAELKSRAAMNCLVDIVQGLLLLVDAVRDGDRVAKLVAEAWFSEKYRGMTLKQKNWKSQIEADLMIVFGQDGLSLKGSKL
jgi:alkylation response protein AidB-like acyl-CoA dehydrogenase